MTKISLKLVGKVDLGHPPAAPAVAGGHRGAGEAVTGRGRHTRLFLPPAYDGLLLHVARQLGVDVLAVVTQGMQTLNFDKEISRI